MEKYAQVAWNPIASFETSEETAYIYPNPTTGIFYIDFEYEGLEVINATKAQILLTFLKGEANDLSSLDQVRVCTSLGC